MDNNKNYIRKIGSDIHSMSFIIGAGFSKNISDKYLSWGELLNDMIHEMYALNDKKLLFAILGKRSALPSDKYFDFLLKMIKDGFVATDAFIVYWQHLQFAVMTETKIVRIFKEIEPCKNGISCILRMAMMFSFGNELVNFPLLKGYLKSLMLRFRFVSATMMDNFDYINIAQKINIKI
jgi:hypothetical protein